MMSRGTFAKALRYVDSMAWDLRIFPPSLHIALTDECWNQCKICGHWKRPNKSTLDWSRLCSLLEFGADNGLETVCLSGGDPFKYPEINALMHKCLELRVDYGIVTAGYCPPWVDGRLVAEARWVRCSIDAINDTYAEVRGGNLTWNDVHQSMRAMRRDGANLQCFTTVSSHNFNHLETLLSWVHDSKMFSEVRLRPAYLHSNQMIDEAKLKKICIDYTLLLETRNTRVDFVWQQFKPEKFDRCWACRYQLFIDANGDIYPCCITAGDTEKSSRVKPLENILHVPQHNGIYWHNRPEAPSSTGHSAIPDYYAAINSWVQNEYTQLPPVCKNECAPRFNQINQMLTDKYIFTKNFF